MCTVGRAGNAFECSCLGICCFFFVVTVINKRQPPSRVIGNFVLQLFGELRGGTRVAGSQLDSVYVPGVLGQ